MACLVQLLTWLHKSDYRNFWDILKSDVYQCIRQLFQPQKRLPKRRQRFVKTGSKKMIIKKSLVIRTIGFFFQISPGCGPSAHQIMYGETFNVSISNGSMKSLYGKFTAKLNFTIGYLF